MKKISIDLYVVERNESVTVETQAINTATLVNLALDGEARALPEGRFKFQASAKYGTLHNLLLLFTFSEAEGGSYQVNLIGSQGGNYKTTIKQIGLSANSLSITFRVGSVGEGRLGIEPPSPWPAG